MRLSDVPWIEARRLLSWLDSATHHDMFESHSGERQEVVDLSTDSFAHYRGPRSGFDGGSLLGGRLRLGEQVQGFVSADDQPVSYGRGCSLDSPAELVPADLVELVRRFE